MTTRQVIAAVLVAFVGACGAQGKIAETALKGKPAPASGKVANLVTNGSFEAGDMKAPAGWRQVGWRGSAVRSVVSSGARTGKRCVLITSDKGADVAWQTTVKLRPYSKYRLSGWIRTEGVKPVSGMGALLNLHGADTRTKAVKGTSDWTRVEAVFDSGPCDSALLNCLFGGWGLAEGKAWYDDISLELLSTRELKPAVAIDAGKKKEPISKYIYGQFIEHLGRCIYGGIWAEMLEDRKFFYPVAGGGSPWKTLGPQGAVKMSADRPYVGKHAPVVQLSGDKPVGIVQGDLAVIKGKEYTGRIILAGDAGAAPVEVSLIWGDKGARRTVTIPKVTKDFTKTPLAFKAGASTDNARLEVVAKGKGRLRIGTLSLMPADNVKGFRPDTLKLLKELDSPVYRWPGGNFVSGYDWRDGVGPRDRRPPRKNPAWRGVEHNDVGIHEFMDLCRLLKTEPYIAVNTGLGGVEAVGQEVQYCNGAAGTAMGKLRAANGHPEPFKVKYWAVGNEMYGRWQKGYMPLEKYVKKHNAVVKAMRAMDPSIQCVGVGAVGKWSETMLTVCADHMELISEHFYCQNRPGLGAHVAQIPAAVRRIAAAHRDYRKRLASLKGKDIRIALDEWNYWYGPHLYGQLGTRYFLNDALGIAAGLHEFFRNSDIYFMANYAQTVNVIGCIKTSRTAAEFATTGLALKLYRKQFGAVPVELTGKPEPLDVVAAWTADRKALTIGVVNPTKVKFDLAIDVKSAGLSGKGRVWWITGPNEKAYNAPGQKPQVTIQEKALTDITNKLAVPPISASVYRLEVK